MKSKRAQAAIEFLTTYGWSFIILVAILGLMGYFGVTNIGDRLPSQCSFDEAFLCSAYIAQSDGSFSFEIVSQLSGEINITKVLCIFPRSDEGVLINLSDSTPYTLARGDNITVSCDYTTLGVGDLGLKKKDRFQAKIIYEDNVAGSLPDLATAEIVSDVSSDRTVYDTYYNTPGAISCDNGYTCTSWDNS
ncbi:hypothetical protein JXA48_00385 [Candidatus Woesearchaeota archaeon]|nr:hypothetical protein [Candidatus Woesearchaeota archaeon]